MIANTVAKSLDGFNQRTQTALLGLELALQFLFEHQLLLEPVLADEWIAVVKA